MELNALSKSQNIPPTINLLLSVSNISFISLKKAFSVEELFLKPHRSVANILFLLMCWYNLVYISYSCYLPEFLTAGEGGGELAESEAIHNNL